MINSVKIENFRGISLLEFKDLKKVNILTGKNNCGKTTVLEALFLLIGMSNPHLALSIHNFRGLILKKNEDLHYLFHKLNFDIHPEITGIFQDHKRTLKLEPLAMQYPEDIENKNSEESKEITNGTILGASTNNYALINGLRLKAYKEGKMVSNAEIGVKRGIQKLNIHYKEQLHGRFINPNTIFLNLNKSLENIIVKKDMDKIIAALKAIEPSLTDLRIGTGGLVYADLGLETLIPINLLGDGIRRILSIITALTEQKNSIILIDEIENGLHHSALKPLWKSILKAVTANSVQLIVATHSFECIQAFAETVQETNFEKKQIALYRIERKDKAFHTFNYNADMLITGVENEIEVR